MLRLRTTSSADAAEESSICPRAPLGISSCVARGAVSAASAALAARHNAATSPAIGPAAHRGARLRPGYSVVIWQLRGGCGDEWIGRKGLLLDPLRSSAPRRAIP